MLRCVVLLILILWIKVCSAYYGNSVRSGQTFIHRMSKAELPCSAMSLAYYTIPPLVQHKTRSTVGGLHQDEYDGVQGKTGIPSIPKMNINKGCAKTAPCHVLYPIAKRR